MIPQLADKLNNHPKMSNTKRNIEVPSLAEAPKKNSVEAASEKVKKLNTDKSFLQSYYMVTRRRTEIKIAPPEKVIEETVTQKIVYKIFSMKDKKETGESTGRRHRKMSQSNLE